MTNGKLTLTALSSTHYVAILQHKEHAPNNNMLVLFLFHVTIPLAHSIDRFLSFGLATQKKSIGAIFGVCLFVRHVICANAIVVAVLILTSIHILYVNHTVYSRANFVIEFNFVAWV